MSNNLIYIAGPISNGDKATARECWKNIERAMKIYGIMIRKGYSPILPHFSYFYWLHSEEDRMSHDKWIKMDTNYIKAADFFFYMEPEIYGKARGARYELRLAKKLHKIIFRDINNIPSYPISYKTCQVGEV